MNKEWTCPDCGVTVTEDVHTCGGQRVTFDPRDAEIARLREQVAEAQEHARMSDEIIRNIGKAMEAPAATPPMFYDDSVRNIYNDRKLLLQALIDYINETGIGSTLLPDVQPPESGTLMAKLAALEAQCAGMPLKWEPVTVGYPEPESGNGWHREAVWKSGMAAITHWVRNTGAEHYSADLPRVILPDHFKTFDGACEGVDEVLAALAKVAQQQGEANAQ